MARTVMRASAWNQNMYERRSAADLTIQKAVFKAWALLPEPYQKNPRMLERYETTWEEDKADAVFLAALAEVYDCRLDELSPLAALRLADLRTLAINSFEAA